MNEAETTVKKGLFEGAARVLTEVLRTPKVREAVRIVLRNLDPENAALVARAATQTDPELWLSFVGSLPALANAMIVINSELIESTANFAPALLDQQAAQLVADTDLTRLGGNLAACAALAVRVSKNGEGATAAALGEAGRRLAGGFSAELERQDVEITTLLDSLVAGAAGLMRRHPAVVRQIVAAGREAIDDVGARND